MEDTSSTVNVSSASLQSSSDSVQSDADKDKKKPSGPPPFVYPAYMPAHPAVCGMSYDFNDGVRIMLDKDAQPMFVRVIETSSHVPLYEGELEPGTGITVGKKYYLACTITAGYRTESSPRWTHVFDACDKDVLVQMPVEGALGDSIAWFSMLERFQKQNNCKLHVLMPKFVQEVFQGQYPEFIFEDRDSAAKLRPYATYYLGLFPNGDTDWQPYDFRLIGLAETAGRILGVEDLSETPPRVEIPEERSIREPYVVIATQASSHAKHWCNPYGWNEVVRQLIKRGYRVLCIDRDSVQGFGDVWHYIPYGCEDWTGVRPLKERVELIAHADFFIGLNSGLSWLAWCCRIPVVLISGICMPFGEFHTPYYVQSRATCHGCWNDTRYSFDHHDYMWCPVHKNTQRAYECTKSITAAQVMSVVCRIPGVREVTL